jgi:iron(III) transport system ATP-binding protein
MTLQFTDVSHQYDEEPVLRGVSLAANEGEILCLLGASGSGKTTLLRLAAGLETLQSGQINLNDRVLSAPGRDVPAEQRQIGMVFQDHALFPHLSIAENVAFGLNQSEAEKNRKTVARVLADVGLVGFEDRYPHTLSGGQQQRVALARAMAPEPSVILLDEPFASIDVSRRRQLRGRSRLALKQSGAITIMVTHDPEEALDMADRIAVMEEGRILQCSEPADLFSNPASALVAGLFGDAQSFPGHVNGNIASFAFGNAAAPNVEDDTKVDVVVRPQGTLIAETTAPSDFRILDVRFRGSHWLVLIGNEKIQAASLHVHLADATAFEAGMPVTLSFDPNNTFVFPAAI